jgi:hypothetical protein
VRERERLTGCAFVGVVHSDRTGYEDDLKNREELRVLNRAGGFPFSMIVSHDRRPLRWKRGRHRLKR